MKHTPRGTRALLAALLVAGAGTAAAGVAEAGGAYYETARVFQAGHGRKARVVVVKPRYRPRAVRYAVIHPWYGRVDFGLYRHGRVWIARPAAVRPFVTRRARVVVVRPVPMWTWAPVRPGIAGSLCVRDGNTSAAFAWADATPAYGCAFCGESFDDYGDWEEHSAGCAHDEFDGQVSFESWGQEDLDYFRLRLQVSGLLG